MSTTNSAAPPTPRTATGLPALSAPVLRVPANLTRWIGVMVRPPRARPPRVSPRALALFGIAFAVMIASMFLFDTKAIELARRGPLWLHDFADVITNYGRSSTFLYPFGIVLLLLAAALSPALSRMSQGVLAALAVPVRDHRQAPHRPRPALCRHARRSIRLHAVHLEAGIRQHALRPRDDSGGRGDCDRRGVAAAAAGDVALCPGHQGEPHSDFRASSERRARRRGGRRGRRLDGAPLVRGAPPRILAGGFAALCVAVVGAGK